MPFDDGDDADRRYAQRARCRCAPRYAREVVDASLLIPILSHYVVEMTTWCAPLLAQRRVMRRYSSEKQRICARNTRQRRGAVSVRCSGEGDAPASALARGAAYAANAARFYARDRDNTRFTTLFFTLTLLLPYYDGYDAYAAAMP